MSESFEQVDSVRIFFKDGSCAFLKNHGCCVDAIIKQLTEERTALAAENERLRKEADGIIHLLSKCESPYLKEDAVAIWNAIKEGGAK